MKTLKQEQMVNIVLISRSLDLVRTCIVSGVCKDSWIDFKIKIWQKI